MSRCELAIPGLVVALCLVAGCAPSGQTATSAGDTATEGRENTAQGTIASGAITARAQEADGVTEFTVRAGVLTNWSNKGVIKLSDVEGDPINKYGSWEKLPSKLKGYYHRVEITLAEMPTAPGEYPVTRLTYSVHDDNEGPFNFGWSEIEGSVVVTEVSGTEDAERDAVWQAHLKARFELRNDRGGEFSGEVAIAPR